VALKLVQTICAFWIIFLVGVAARTAVTVVQEQDNGKEIRVRAGEVIELSLPMQAGTGYIWEVHHLDQKHLKAVHTEIRSLSGQNLPGGPMLQVWRLKTLAPGETKLKLDYLRPWEGRSKAVKHFEVKVRID
jgi:predicted secreted protein